MKRKGFTLIELMVVIAIIIILAAIAIPNYLKMTERAKKSRIASDMATLATGLETFRTDWGSYPGSTTAIAVNDPTSAFMAEMTGVVSGAVPVINIATATNSVGEAGGPTQVYLKVGTLTSIVDPFGTGTAPADNKVYYISDANSGAAHWMLFAYSSGIAATGKYLYRTDGSSTVVEQTRSAPAISTAGVPTY